MSSLYRIFESMQDVAFVVDESCNLHFGNTAAALLLEVSGRRLTGGKPLANFLEFLPGLLNEGQSLNEIDEPTQYRELQFTTVNGKSGWAQVSLQSIPEEVRAASGSEKRRWIVYLRDVSLEKTLHDKYKTELDQKEAVIEDLRKARNELENYSKNLEKMVAARTSELRESNRLLETVLDSLGQGIFVFDQSGKVLPFFSKISEKMFGLRPAGMAITDVLRLSREELDTFQKWIGALFSEMLPFEDLASLGPQHFNSADGRYISLDFQPMRGEDQGLQGVVLVATDRTAEIKAKKEAERERSFARRVVLIVQHRQQFRLFVAESTRICTELAQKIAVPVPLDAEETARYLHTIKGGAASFSMPEIAEIAHQSEEVLSAHLRASAAHETVSWSSEVREQLRSGIEAIRSHLAEFVDTHSFLVGGPIERADRFVEIPVGRLAEWHQRMKDPAAVRQLRREILEDWVFEPVGHAFAHVGGSLQELAKQLDKRLKPLEIIGHDLRVLPEAFSDLFPTFIHAFRNAIDHGIELPDERVAAGKEAEGSLEIRFARVSESGVPFLKIEIHDDGRGIDPEKIRIRLREKGLAFDPQAANDEVIQAVFRDDFSTSQTVTRISGRGVGLSAIKEQAERMGGRCLIRSETGFGSTVTVLVPDRSDAVVLGLKAA